MAEERVKRKLAAIVSADVVGWSRLMGEDEAGTLATLKRHREELIDPKIEEYGGRIVSTAGDSVLVEYPSAVDAVKCSVEIQEAMAERNADLPEDRKMLFRVGVNLGEVIIDGEDVFGDGVNVAARLQALAEPGAVCLSGDVQRQVKGKLAVAFEDLGAQSVKNIAEPVRVYAVRREGLEVGAIPLESDNLPLPSKPSIAVLPFDNMSGDPEQDYFSDGIADEIITALSQSRDLFVIARNSSFTYKGRATDIRRIGQELGVRYVLEGGVRKAGDRLRVLAQLIDAETGKHVWADKYDGHIEDVFDLQDEITAKVTAAIGPTVLLSEIERARRKRPDRLDAYELCMRGRAHEMDLDKHGLSEARKCYLKATDLDGRPAQAYAGIAGTYWWEAVLGLGDFEQNLAEALRAGRQAVETDESDATGHIWVGYPSMFSHRLDVALSEAERAVELSPSNALAHGFRGVVYCFTGRPQEAVDENWLALRLSPRDMYRFFFLHMLAFSLYTVRDYAAAADAALKIVALKPDYPYGHWHLASSCAQLGQTERAATALQELMRILPNFDRAFVEGVAPYVDSSDLEHLIEGLRKAGWEG